MIDSLQISDQGCPCSSRTSIVAIIFAIYTPAVKGLMGMSSLFLAARTFEPTSCMQIYTQYWNLCTPSYCHLQSTYGITIIRGLLMLWVWGLYSILRLVGQHDSLIMQSWTMAKLHCSNEAWWWFRYDPEALFVEKSHKFYLNWHPV